jgi:hypothetical protein
MFRKAPPPSNPHDYVEERLSSFIDGQLSEEERGQVRRHLQSCPRCQESLDSLGWTVKLLKQVPAPALPRQFTLPMPEPKGASTPAPWLKWGLAAASAVAAVAFVFLATVDLLSRGGGLGQSIAMPAAVPAQPTSVAVLAPTSAPAALDRTAPPTSAPIPEPPTLAPPVSEAQATAAPPPTQAQSSRQFTEPSETTAPLTTKSGALTPSCEGCGGGPGGGPAVETPYTLTITAASPVVAIGSVKDGPLSVRAAPSDKAPRIGMMARGTIVQVLDRDRSSDWLQIVFPIGNDQGSTGWVMARFVNLQVPANSLPTAEPPTVTPAQPPGMTILRPQGKQSPPAQLAQVPSGNASTQPTPTRSPNETSPPTATATANAPKRPSPTSSASPTIPPSRTPPPIVLAYIPDATPPPSPSFQGNELSALRLGEIVTLVVFLVFAAAMFFLTRA